MKLKPMILALLLGWTLMGCETGGDANLTSTGFPYTLYQTGEGEKAKAGEWVYFHLRQQVGADIRDSRTAGLTVPNYFLNGREMDDSRDLDPVIEVLTLMSPGDSAMVTFPFDSLGPGWSMQYPEDSAMFMSVELVEVKPDADVTGGVALKLDGLNEQYKAGELDGQVEYTEDSLGIYIVEQGDGPLPGDSATVAVNYYGIFPDGLRFDDSFQGGNPLTFRLGEGGVIDGWDIGIAMLKQGTEAVLFVPSDLAYGPRGSRSIPPNQDLVFLVKLEDIME